MNRLTYVIGALAGLIAGGTIGYLKNLFIWQRYLKESESAGADPRSIGGLYARAFISYSVNILTLAAAFFARNILPFDGIAFLIGTAAALAIMNKVLAVRQKKPECNGREA